MNDVDWALTARVIIWTVLAFFALGVLEFLAWASYVEIRKLLRALRARRESQALLESERRRVRLDIPREEMIEAVKRDAVEPITDSAWQDRARRAEALGFMDDGSDLPRAS